MTAAVRPGPVDLDAGLDPGAVRWDAPEHPALRDLRARYAEIPFDPV